MSIHNILSRSVSGILLAGCLTACGSGDDEQQGMYPEATVGVSISSTDSNPFFQSMYRSFESAAKSGNRLTVILDQADNRQDLQNTQTEAMLKRGAKALVVNLADVSQDTAFVQTMCDRGVPVVYINRSPNTKSLASCPNAYVVDGDAAQAGVLQGLQVLRGWKANPKWDKNRDGVIQYALLEGIPGHLGAQARSKWAVGTMENYPNMGVPVQKLFQETAMFREQNAEQVTARWVKSPDFSRVEVILANNDSMALGVLKILKRYNMNLPVFGIDGSRPALEAWKAGRLTGTVFNDYDGQARTALRMAANLASGRPVLDGVAYDMEYRTVRVPYQDIDNNNLEHFLKLNQ